MDVKAGVASLSHLSINFALIKGQLMHQLLHRRKDLTCRKNLAQQWMKGQVIAVWSLFVLSLVWLNVSEAK